MSKGLTNLKGLLLLLLLFVFVRSNCQDIKQDIKVKGGFFEDSIKIGEHARYFLTARYPSKINILFPDSTFKFSPLEFRRSEYFTTETTNGISYDSVIYHLASFDIDSLQGLSLPIFQINQKDCTLHQSNSDTIRLILMSENIDTVSLDKIPLKHQNAYQPVAGLFNYPALFIIIGVTILIVAIGWFIFGKSISRHFKIKRMVKAHQTFLSGFDAKVDTLQKQYSPLSTEVTLAHWKKYLEQLERVPYTKLTSREIQRLEKDEQLGKTLQGIDAAIYGHNTQAVILFESLKSFAQARFDKKLEEVKHG